MRISDWSSDVCSSDLNNFRKLASLTGTSSQTPRLVFWPEAAIPAFLDMEPEWRNRLAALLGPNDLLLTGGVKLYVEYEDKGGYQSSKLLGANNSLWVLTPDRKSTRLNSST